MTKFSSYMRENSPQSKSEPNDRVKVHLWWKEHSQGSGSGGQRDVLPWRLSPLRAADVSSRLRCPSISKTQTRVPDCKTALSDAFGSSSTLTVFVFCTNRSVYFCSLSAIVYTFWCFSLFFISFFWLAASPGCVVFCKSLFYVQVGCASPIGREPQKWTAVRQRQRRSAAPQTGLLSDTDPHQKMFL